MGENGRDGDQVAIDYMARDFDSLLSSMRDRVPELLDEWTEYESEADFGNVLLELFAHMGDILSYYQDRVAAESYLGTARSRRSVIHHLRLIGYRLSTAAPASTELRLILPADFDDTLTIRRGDAFSTKSTEDRPSVRFEYAEEADLEILPADLEDATVDGKARRVYDGVPVEEGRLVEGDLLGTSDGSPNQRLRLGRGPLILKSLGEGRRASRDIVVTTVLGDDRREWKLLDSLAFSGEGESDFVVEIDEEDRATVMFGDGDFGAIPPAGAEIRATYRIGGGRVGNVPKGAVTILADAPRLSLAAAQVTNPDPATGGAERESIEHAVRHAPEVFRSLKRAVTGADWEALAREFAGVGKVRAEAGNWNEVALHVAPEGGGAVSDVLRAGLLAYFEGLRPLSTIVRVKDVDYVEVHVTAEITVTGYYPAEEVVERVRSAAGALLAFENVDFARPVYLSKFYEAIEAVEGVAFATVTEFRSEKTEVPAGEDPSSWVEPSGRLDMAAYEVPVGAEAYGGGIRIVPSGGF